MHPARNYFYRQPTGSSELIEFAPVMFAAVSFCLLVTVNLAAIALAYASVYIIALESCSRAAKANSFEGALKAMSTDSIALIDGPLGKIGRLSASGGYEGSGADLYVAATNIYTSKTTVHGPNKALPNVNTADNVYECCAQVHYTVAPLMNFSSIAILGEIPGFGKPLTLTCSTHRAIEQPNAFSLETAATRMSTDASTDQTALFGTKELADWDMWSTPSRFQPGQVIAQQADGVIAANNSQWVQLNDAQGNSAAIKKGQRLTLVVNMNALWSPTKTNYTGPLGGSEWANGMPLGTIEFKVGPNGTVYRPYSNTQNMELPGEGELYFRSNSVYANASLVQHVQVLITN